MLTVSDLPHKYTPILMLNQSLPLLITAHFDRNFAFKSHVCADCWRILGFGYAYTGTAYLQYLLKDAHIFQGCVLDLICLADTFSVSCVPADKLQIHCRFIQPCIFHLFRNVIRGGMTAWGEHFKQSLSPLILRAKERRQCSL